jgi:hypothetical protein
MMSRITLVLLLVVVAAGLACGDTDTSESAEPAAATAITPTSEPIATPSPEPTATQTPAPTATATPSPTPAAPLPLAGDVVEASTEAMKVVPSFHFEMDIVASIESEDLALELPIEISGDYLAPDKIKASLKMTVIFLIIETEMVSLGNTQYIKDPETGEWQVTAGESSILMDPGQFVEMELENLRDLKMVGLETLDGVEVYHLTATATEGTYGGGGGEFQLSMWIRSADGLVARVVAEGDVDIGEAAGGLLGDVGEGASSVTLTATLSNFGEDVAIEAPILAPAATPTAAPAPPVLSTPIPLNQGASVVPDPDALLQLINDSMNEIGSVHIEGEALIKESEDAESALMSIQFEGDDAPNGDSRMLMAIEIDLGGFAGSINYETRVVGGVSFIQDPFTTQWQIDEGDSSPLDVIGGAVGVADIAIENMTVELAVLDGLDVYHITGSVPDEPEVNAGVIWVGVDDLLVRKLQLSGQMAANELEGLVPAGSGEVFMSTTFTFSKFGEPVTIEAPAID